jgi:hypothetical protein
MKHQVAESVQVWRRIQASATSSNNGAASTTTTTDETVGRMSEDQARILQQKFATLRRQCRSQQRKLDRCTDATDEGEYARASMDLTICMAQTVCPVQHSALVQCLSSKNNNDEAIAQALSVVQECVTLQAEHHAAAKKEFPHVLKA